MITLSPFIWGSYQKGGVKPPHLILLKALRGMKFLGLEQPCDNPQRNSNVMAHRKHSHTSGVQARMHLLPSVGFLPLECVKSLSAREVHQEIHDLYRCIHLLTQLCILMWHTYCTVHAHKGTIKY